MKLISYTQDHATRYGVLLDQGVVDMRHCMDKAPDSINDFFALASGNAALMASIAQRAASAQASPLSKVSLLPCVPRPSKIICLGVNYHDHAAEGGNKVAVA